MLFELVQSGSRIVEISFLVHLQAVEHIEMNKEELIGLLKTKVEEKMGRSLVTPTDFNRLSLQMQQEMGESISVSTVKRVWNYVSSHHHSSVDTLACLARFVGYRDWVGFVDACSDGGGEEESAFLSEPQIRTDGLSQGDMLEFSWAPDRFCRVMYLGDNRFQVLESLHGKLRDGDTFQATMFSLGLPLIVTGLHRNGVFLGAYIAGRRGGIYQLNRLSGKNHADVE